MRRQAAYAAALLVGAAASLGAQGGAPRDTVIRRGDRAIHHESMRGEREWGYAQSVVVGSTIHVSGTIGRGATMEEQVAAIYRRIARTLAVHGATLQDVVKETVYTKDMDALAAANAARKAAYGTHTPAATWVQITRLLEPSALVEIEVTAVLPARPGPTD